jgi:hypothetical protein
MYYNIYKSEYIQKKIVECICYLYASDSKAQSLRKQHVRLHMCEESHDL